MVEPKYKIGDWVKLHAITPKGLDRTYHVLGITIDICEAGVQVTYKVSEHSREQGITGRVLVLPEMQIDAFVGTTIT